MALKKGFHLCAHVFIMASFPVYPVTNWTLSELFKMGVGEVGDFPFYIILGNLLKYAVAFDAA